MPDERVRTIVCFGDSNTWGFEPVSGHRYGPALRWPGVLRRELGHAWHVVEAGLNGRTTVYEDPPDDLCALRHVGPALEPARPVDVVVVLLGTNDLKARFGASAADVAAGAGRVVDAIRAGGHGPGGAAPDVLLVAPPPLALPADPARRAAFESEWRLAEAADLARPFAAVARARGVSFLGAGAVVRTSERDGVHWEATGHEAFGVAVAQALRGGDTSA